MQALTWLGDRDDRGAGATRHTAEQDKAWIKPDDLPAIARAITRLHKEDGTAFADEQARRIERMMDRSNVATILRAGDISPLDVGLTLNEPRWADEGMCPEDRV